MAQPGPNPQTNLIISIVLPVVALITVAALYFTKPVISAPGAPTPVNTGAVTLPPANVQQANALPGGGGGAGPAGGARPGGGMAGGVAGVPMKAGPVGFGGPPTGSMPAGRPPTGMGGSAPSK